MIQKDKIIRFGMVAAVVLVAAVVVGTVTVAEVVGQNATGSSGSTSGQEQTSEFERERPPERIRSVSSDVYISSHEWEDGDVVVELVARNDGELVTVQDGMSEWDADADEYVESFNLDEGAQEVRVPDAGTMSPEDSGREFYGVLVEQADSRGAAAGTVGTSFNPPMPSSGATFWLTVLFGTFFAGLAGYFVSKKRDGKKRLRDLKPKRW